MSFRKFKFISPGVFVNEIDNSQIPRAIGDVGPVVIGRSQRGPGLKPVTVNSFDELIQTFGNPTPGGAGGDHWREGNQSAPTYAMYAAQAWLRNSSPLTFVRLLGKTHSDATATSDGFAGWQTTKTALTTANGTNGGAFGLFIVEGTGALSADSITVDDWDESYFHEGTLAAVWYLNDGSIALSGNNLLTTPVPTTGAAQFISAVDNNLTFKVKIFDSSGNVTLDAPFNFTENSPNYIRKVFNTNPTLTNSSIAEDSTNYWLGESFEGHLRTVELSSSRPWADGGDTPNQVTTGISGTVPSATHGIILPLGTPNGSINGGDFRITSTKTQNAGTGWFFAQNFAASGTFNPDEMQKLFRLRALDFGEETQRSIKVSIKDIKQSDDPFNKYGSFTVAIRDMRDTDDAPIYLEQYNNCNLNPASDNYIGNKIGDITHTWSDDERRYTQQGQFDIRSKYVTVQVKENVGRGMVNPECLPFGVYGAPRYNGIALSGTVGYDLPARNATTAQMTEMAGGSGPFIQSGSALHRLGSTVVTGSGPNGTGTSNSIWAKFRFPTLRLRQSASEGNLSDKRDAFFGADTTYNTDKFDESVMDVLRYKAEAIDNLDASSNYTTDPTPFTLDNIRNSKITGRMDLQSTYAKNDAVYQSGSHNEGLAYTSHTGTVHLSASYTNVLKAGFDRFTTCMHGGQSGLNIKEREAFNNTRALASEETVKSSYAYNSVKIAIDACRDPEIVEMNAICMPGITNNGLNTTLVRMAEDRGDTLAIIDLQGGYKPDTEDSSSHSSRAGSVDTTVDNMRETLQLNSSYGCAYYPWVKIRDNINGNSLWVPPSVVALGAMSYGQAKSQLWFAPAGFTRGGLSANNAAGLPVVGVEQRLTSKERDKLYDANVNPIAQFPAEGIVIFGQKTLQVTPSALDRINVRRLMIHLKRQISRMAATVLFDQNVDATWARFKSSAEPFLRNVKAGLGITDYRLILDRTTTTPDLIDRNIMYAKIIIKPARAIEYIAIDFVITNSGASFTD